MLSLHGEGAAWANADLRHVRLAPPRVLVTRRTAERSVRPCPSPPFGHEEDRREECAPLPLPPALVRSVRSASSPLCSRGVVGTSQKGVCASPSGQKWSARHRKRPQCGWSTYGFSLSTQGRCIPTITCALCSASPPACRRYAAVQVRTAARARPTFKCRTYYHTLFRSRARLRHCPNAAQLPSIRSRGSGGVWLTAGEVRLPEPPALT